jgi:hypothetical protein
MEIQVALATKSWQRVSIHDVVAEFLKAERFKFPLLRPSQLAHIDNADTTDPETNHQRLRWLLEIRRLLVGEIPPDTVWFEVATLTNEELNELHVIKRCGWDSPDDENELRLVARRKPVAAWKHPADWRKPILWGHQESGPFTIIDGNNRLVAYATSQHQIPLSIPVLVGLSPTPCGFHFSDPGIFVANDLWKT